MRCSAQQLASQACFQPVWRTCAAPPCPSVRHHLQCSSAACQQRSATQVRAAASPSSEVSQTEEERPPLPPFTRETAVAKVRAAEDGWNSRNPAKVATAYTLDTQWRNRVEFVNSRAEAQAFLERKWNKELDYRLIKELWAVDLYGYKLAVRYAYEWRDDSGNWFRSYGNENWEFWASGLMAARHSSLNDLPIAEDERLFRWPLGRRPDDHPGLSELGL